MIEIGQEVKLKSIYHNLPNYYVVERRIYYVIIWFKVNDSDLWWDESRLMIPGLEEDERYDS